MNPTTGGTRACAGLRPCCSTRYGRRKFRWFFDESVDAVFGTRAVKITPAHDRYDFELAKRHRLPLVEWIDCKRRILDGFGHFTDLPRCKARIKMMDYLTERS